MALRAAGPFDALRRRATGRSGLPPLWLRRHTGPLRHVASAAAEMAELLARRDLVAPGCRVLDIGCGAGMMAVELARMVGPEGRYVGSDIHIPSIRWCRSRFRGDARLRFEVADAGAGPLPGATGQADLVLAKSLFTHLTEEEAGVCLAEIRRALALGGTALITAFLFDGAAGAAAASAYFPFGNADGSSRWRWKARPRSAIAFDRSRFEALVSRAGLEVRELLPSFWPGAAEPSGQDILLVGYADGATVPVGRAAPQTP
jgi:SAM-dependent methyltransferase